MRKTISERALQGEFLAGWSNGSLRTREYVPTFSCDLELLAPTVIDRVISLNRGELRLLAAALLEG